MDRKALILSEFHTYLPDSASILELMNLSDRANKVREDRRKAATNGQTYIG